MIIPGVTMTRRSEIEWLYHGVAPLFPAQWARFRDHVAGAERDRAWTGAELVAAYYQLLHGPDQAVCQAAAYEWCRWENSLVSIDPDATPDASRMTPDFELAFARIVTHYFHHAAWLEEGVLLRQAHRLARIPAVLIHGRFDVGAPLVSAWELAQAWPDAELVIVPGAGHSTSDPGMPEAIRAATDRFAPQG